MRRPARIQQGARAVFSCVCDGYGPLSYVGYFIFYMTVYCVLAGAFTDQPPLFHFRNCVFQPQAGALIYLPRHLSGSLGLVYSGPTPRLRPRPQAPCGWRRRRTRSQKDAPAPDVHGGAFHLSFASSLVGRHTRRLPSRSRNMRRRIRPQCIEYGAAFPANKNAPD